MTRRILDSDIWTNENFAALPSMARLLQIGIINLADDQGRMKAHPAYLRSQIFPYDEIPAEQIDEWLHLLEQNETLLVYQVDGKQYVQLVNWWEYQGLQWARPSRFPAPRDWQDRIRANGAGRDILTYNWTTPTGARVEDTCDQDGNPLGTQPRTPPPSQPRTPPPSQPRTPPPSQPRTPINYDHDHDQTTTTTSADGADCGGCGAGCDITPVIEAWGEYEMTPKATPQTQQRLRDDVTQHGAPYVLECIRIAADAGQPTMRYYRGVLRKGPDSPRASPNGTGQYAGMTVVPDEGDDDG